MKSNTSTTLFLAVFVAVAGSAQLVHAQNVNCRMVSVTNPLCGFHFGRTCFDFSYPCWKTWWSIGTCTQEYCFTDYTKITFKTCDLPLDCAVVTCQDDQGITRQVDETWYIGGCQQQCKCTSSGNIECSCNRRVRKEIRQMLDDEFDTYARGVNILKESGEWAQLMNLHTQESGIGHGNDGFWPWHRAFLHHVETRLQQVTGSCSLAIPYYEWSIGAQNPWQSGVFSSTYFGSNEVGSTSCINDGPFAGWTGAGGECVRRSQMQGTTFLDYQGIRNNFINSASYTSARQSVEYGFLMHGSIHGRIGGHMTDPRSAPYDPVFYSHHAMVDKLWDEWQTAHPGLASGTGNIAGNTQYTSFGMSVSDTVDLDGDAMCVTYEDVNAAADDGGAAADGDNGGGRRLATKKNKEKKKLRGRKPGSALDKKEFKRNVFTKWLSISEKNVKDRWVDKTERGDVMVVAKQIITGMKQKKNKRRRRRQEKKKNRKKNRNDVEKEEEEEEEIECVRTCPLPDMDLDIDWIDQKAGKMSKKEMKAARKVLKSTRDLQERRVRIDLAKPTDLDFCFNVADFFDDQVNAIQEVGDVTISNQ